MEEYIAADPQSFDQHELLQKLQSLSLKWREQDPFVTLVRNQPTCPGFHQSKKNKIARVG